MGYQAKTLTTYRKASFWSRLGAILIDAVVITMVMVPLKLIFRLDDAIWGWLDFFVFYGYNTFMDYYFQGSLGKMCFDLRVISREKKRVSFMSSFYRNFGKMVSAMPYMYGYFRILAPHQEQTIHDELSHCYVVQVVGQGEHQNRD